MFEKKADVRSFEELVRRLEHVELEQFDTDIRANVRAELPRMKRNIVAILSFLANCKEQKRTDLPEIYEAMSSVRRQCVDLNMAISRLQVLLFFRIENLAAFQPSQVIIGPYQRLGDALRLMYQMSAPQFLEELSATL